MKRHFAGLSLIVVLLSIGAAQLPFSSRAPQNGFKERLKQKTGEATPIQEGVMTEKQKKHGKLFKGFANVTQGKKLRDLYPEENDVYVVKAMGMVLKPRDFDLSEYLHSLACRSDAVVIGTVKAKASQVTEEGMFIFTDYEVTISDILKDNISSPINLNAGITFTSTGGAVQLNGRTIRAVDRANEPLEVSKKYLLYLKFIPETGAYRGFSNDLDSDTYQLTDDQVIQASEKPLPLGTKRTAEAASFMAVVRATLDQSCNK